MQNNHLNICCLLRHLPVRSGTSVKSWLPSDLAFLFFLFLPCLVFRFGLFFVTSIENEVSSFSIVKKYYDSSYYPKLKFYFINFFGSIELILL